MANFADASVKIRLTCRNRRNADFSLKSFASLLIYITIIFLPCQEWLQHFPGSILSLTEQMAQCDDFNFNRMILCLIISPFLPISFPIPLFSFIWFLKIKAQIKRLFFSSLNSSVILVYFNQIVKNVIFKLLICLNSKVFCFILY